VIAIFMFFATLAPLGILPLGPQDRLVYSIFWILLIHFSYIMFVPAMMTLMGIIVPLYTFSILYVRQIVRFFYGKSTRDSAIMCGLLSVAFPSLVGVLVSILLGLPYSQYLYIIPVPIQFAVGLHFLYKFREPEAVSPWSGQFIDWSWWKRLGTRWSNWIVDRIEIHLDEEEIVMGMGVDEAEAYLNQKYEADYISCENCSRKVRPIALCKECRKCLDCCSCEFIE
jgi:hypothetical protein